MRSSRPLVLSLLSDSGGPHARSSLLMIRLLLARLCLKGLERQLKSSRQKAAKQRRIDNPSLVFKDLPGPCAKPVETIVDKVSAVVSQVFPEESAVAFDLPVPWRPDLCRRAERTGDWPAQVLDARVSALEKTPDAATVVQYRPICVLSVTYRTWSSLRAKEALEHLASIAPPTLFGNMPGRSAGGVWYQMQLAIEQAHMDDHPMGYFWTCPSLQHLASPAGFRPGAQVGLAS